MELTKEDFEAYMESQIAHQKVTMMTIEANKAILKWLKQEIKKR